MDDFLQAEILMFLDLELALETSLQLSYFATQSGV
jgi:hypothetical protein